jgi:hypothetical protein
MRFPIAPDRPAKRALIGIVIEICRTPLVREAG